MDKLEFLKTVRPFNVLSEDVLLGVVELLQEVRYTKDTPIYHQEVTKMRGVDIIAEGEYEAFFYDSEQNKRVIELHHAGYCYGGVSVLLNRKKSLRSVIAKKGTVCTSCTGKISGRCARQTKSSSSFSPRSSASG